MRNLVLASMVLLLLANVVVLAGVAYNRSGDPTTTIELTERELPVAYSYRSENENSGTALSLKWNVLDAKDPVTNYSNYGTPAWLDEARLVELGFDLQELGKEKYRYRLDHYSNEVIVVLEYNGDAYQRALDGYDARATHLREMVASFPGDTKLEKQLEAFEKQQARIKLSQSRLYAVDAGLDEQELIQRYTDNNRYIFVRGVIGISRDNDGIRGYIKRLLVKHIHAPLPLSQHLTNLSDGAGSYTYKQDPLAPRYRVRLNFGKRLEPWVAEVTAPGK